VVVNNPAPRTRHQRSRTGRLSRLKSAESSAGFLFAAPGILIVALVFAVPLALTFWMSVNDWPLLGDPAFNGLENYRDITENQLFLNSVVFTLTYTVLMTVIYLLVALGLGLLVQNSRRGVGIFRTAFLLPAAVGVSSAALLFYSMYNNEFGPLADLFRLVGLADGDPNFLGTPTNAFLSTVAMVTWRFAGFNMMIMLVGLQAIPLDVYEAARMDGARWFKQLRYITIPLLRPTILLILVLSVTSSMLSFEPFYIMTAGGPNNSTVTVVMASFREAFSLFNLGTATAMSVLLLLVLLVINLLQVYALRARKDKTE
jgi:multiple sugar transport system permease protein